jgi:hypothetical protein
LLAVELSAGKRHAAMRACIAQGEGPALLVASDYEWLFQQHRLGQLPAAELIRRKRAVPETKQHQRIGRLGLEWKVVGH